MYLDLLALRDIKTYSYCDSNADQPPIFGWLVDTIYHVLCTQVQEALFDNNGVRIQVCLCDIFSLRPGSDDGTACLFYQSHVQCLLPLEKGMRGGNKDNLYCQALHFSSWYFFGNFNKMLVSESGAYSEIRFFLGGGKIGVLGTYPYSPDYRNVLKNVFLLLRFSSFTYFL